jgi:predicted enzyme related to lactoylglutathione lyase
MNTFDWVEIKTKNIKRAANFYQSLFDWKIIDKDKADGSDVWIFDTGSQPRIKNLQRGGLWLKIKDESIGIVVYILVEDIQSILNKVKKLGGKIIIPKTPQGSAFRACFSDLDGNLFGLWEEKNKTYERSANKTK